jgi:hypothetical protein
MKDNESGEDASISLAGSVAPVVEQRPIRASDYSSAL